MIKQYQLIHLDTKEVTMCEKITIYGKDYFYSPIKIEESLIDSNVHIFISNNEMIKCLAGGNIGRVKTIGEYYLIIATINTSLQCPQVVDYVEELANEYLAISNEYLAMKFHKNLNTLEEENLVKEGFSDGFYKHSEKHSLSDKECCLFLDWYNDIFLNYLCGLDTDENYEKYKHLKHKGVNKEVLEIFKQTLPTKVYYR